MASLARRAQDTIRMAAPKPVRAMNSDRLKIFTGSANPILAEELCGCLGIPLGKASLRQFADGEIYLQIQENVPGADVFVVQPTCTPVDRNLMQLLLMIDALKRSSHNASRQCYPIMDTRGGSEGQTARSHLGQAGCQPDREGRREPDSGAGFTCSPDSGFL